MITGIKNIIQNDGLKQANLSVNSHTISSTINQKNSVSQNKKFLLKKKENSKNIISDITEKINNKIHLKKKNSIKDNKLINKHERKVDNPELTENDKTENGKEIKLNLQVSNFDCLFDEIQTEFNKSENCTISQELTNKGTESINFEFDKQSDNLMPMLIDGEVEPYNDEVDKTKYELNFLLNGFKRVSDFKFVNEDKQSENHEEIKVNFPKLNFTFDNDKEKGLISKDESNIKFTDLFKLNQNNEESNQNAEINEHDNLSVINKVTSESKSSKTFFKFIPDNNINQTYQVKESNVQWNETGEGNNQSLSNKGNNPLSNNLNKEKIITELNQEVFTIDSRNLSSSQKTELKSLKSEIYTQSGNIEIKDIPATTTQLIRNLGGDGTLMARFSLHPENLGFLMVEVSLQGNLIKLNLKADTGEAVAGLETQLDILKNKLSEQGLKVESVEIGLNKDENDILKDKNNQSESKSLKEERKEKFDFIKSFINEEGQEAIQI